MLALRNSLVSVNQPHLPTAAGALTARRPPGTEGWGSGGGLLPRRTGHPARPEGRWCRLGAMPGGQGRMSGTPPPRSSRRRAHSCLTACPGLRLAGHGRWLGGDAPSARAAPLASSAALPVLARVPSWPGLRPLRWTLRRPLAAAPPSSGGRITAGYAPSWGQSAAKPRPDWPPRGVERPRRVVRFARLIDRRGRAFGGPAVRAASGGHLSLPGYHAGWYGRTGPQV